MKIIARIIHRNAGLVLIGTFLITAGMMPGVLKIKPKEGTTPESNFTAPNEIIRSLREIKNTFGANTRTSVIAVETSGSRTIPERETLELIQNLSKDIQALPIVRKESLLSLTTVVDFVGERETMRALPLLSEIPQDYAQEKAFREKLKANDMVYGRLVTKDFRTSLLVFSIQDGVGLEKIHRYISGAMKPYENQLPGVTVSLAGTPEIDYQLDSSIRRETALFMFLALVLLVLAFLVIFKTWKGVFIPFTTVTIAIIWTMGLMGYYGKPIDIVSALLPVLLVVTGSSYAIHVFHQLVEEVTDRASFEKAYHKILKRLAAPLMMSAGTTFVGSVTLLAFRIEMIQHFGLFCGVGTLINFVISLIVIPAFYAVLAKRVSTIENHLEEGFQNARDLAQTTLQSIPVAGAAGTVIAETMSESIIGGWKGFVRGLKRVKPADKTLRGLARLVNRYPYVILGITAILMVFSWNEMTKLVISFDNLSVLPKGYPIRTVTERLNKSFNGIQSFEIMLDTGKEGGATNPEFLAKVESLQKEFLESQHVSHVFSIVDVLKKMDSVLNPNPKVKDGALPNTSDAISQYLLLLSFSSSGSFATANMITSDSRKIKLTLTTNVNETRGFGLLYQELKDKAERRLGTMAEVGFGGNPMVWIAMMNVVIWGKIQNVLVSLLLILFIIAATHRSIVRGLVTILSLPVGVLANFGLMGHMGIRLDIVTAIITSFAMGIGVDFSVHFISAVENEYKKTKNMEQAITQAIAGPGKAIMYNAIATKVGFSALLFSRFSAINTFAILMCFSMSVLALSALTVLPAVLRIMPPEFITRFRKTNRVPEPKLSFALKLGFTSAVCASLIAGILFVEQHLRQAGERKAKPDVTVMTSVTSQGSDSGAS